MSEPRFTLRKLDGEYFKVQKVRNKSDDMWLGKVVERRSLPDSKTEDEIMGEKTSEDAKILLSGSGFTRRNKNTGLIEIFMQGNDNQRKSVLIVFNDEQAKQLACAIRMLLRKPATREPFNWPLFMASISAMGTMVSLVCIDQKKHPKAILESAIMLFVSLVLVCVFGRKAKPGKQEK